MTWIRLRFMYFLFVAIGFACSADVEELFYDSGKIKATVGLVDGKRDGKMIVYSEQGRVIKEISWKQGKRDGMEIIYYPSGYVNKKRNWKGGLLDGIEKAYDTDGSLHSVGVFNRGRISRMAIYSNDTSLVERQVYDTAGRLIYVVSFDQSGKKRMPFLPPIFEPVNDTIRLGQTYRVSFRLGVYLKGTLHVSTGRLDSSGKLEDEIELDAVRHNTFIYSIKPTRSGQITVPFLFRLDPAELDTIHIEEMFVKHTFYVDAGDEL